MTAGPRRTSVTPPLDKETVDALQGALATEHAALWCYSLAVAFLAGPPLDQARTDSRDHLELRGAVERTLSRVGIPAVSAQPAYATPQPVTDAKSAAALLEVAESDTMAAWRSLVERTSDQGMRRSAVQALCDATLRCARWRVVVGHPPAIPVFPGRQDSI
jgi:uncharacterized protein DUF4439